MSTHTIRSLILLQIAIAIIPLLKCQDIKDRKRMVATRCGLFVCWIGIIFCDIQLLPEVFGAMLVFLNLLLLGTGQFALPRSLAWLKYSMVVSLVLFTISFALRLDVFRRVYDLGISKLSRFGENVSVVEDVAVTSAIDRKVKASYEHLKELDTIEGTNVFFLYQEDTNYVFKTNGVFRNVDIIKKF